MPRRKMKVLAAVGATGGITFSNEKWRITDPKLKQRNKYIFGFNGSVFAELFEYDYTSVISELQFNQKGTVEKGTSNRNKMNYLCFNNFFKIRYDLPSMYPYILMGPRVEYLLSQGISSPIITDNFRKLHVTASVGAGVEFVGYSRLRFFTEAHFNPDVMRSYKHSDLAIRAKAFELRVGLKFVFGDKKIPCP
jgi:hypothetical protein